jgi:HEPN domain-containing protein
MKQREQAMLLFNKGSQDAALVDEVLESTAIGDEIVGFHCQQAAEKFLKALLSAAGLTFQRTHNLRQLMDLLSDAGQCLPPELEDLDTLTPFGTTFRYDMLPIAHDFDRKRAREMVQRLQRWTRERIGK